MWVRSFLTECAQGLCARYNIGVEYTVTQAVGIYLHEREDESRSVYVYHIYGIVVSGASYCMHGDFSGCKSAVVYFCYGLYPSLCHSASLFIVKKFKIINIVYGGK